MIVCDRKWGAGYWTHQAGDGTLTVRDGVVLRADGVGAQVIRAIELAGGDTLRFSCLARNVTSGQEGFLYIDSPHKGPTFNKDTVSVKSEDFEEYSVSYTAPLHQSNVRLLVGLGNSGLATGPITSEYLCPRIEIIKGSGFGSMRTLACGLLRNVGSGWEVHPDFCNINIASVEKGGVNNWLVVKFDISDFKAASPGNRSRKPLVFVSSTPNNTNFFPVAGGVVGFDDSQMKLDVALVDPATKSMLDPNTVTNAYVTLEVKMF